MPRADQVHVVCHKVLIERVNQQRVAATTTLPTAQAVVRRNRRRVRSAERYPDGAGPAKLAQPGAFPNSRSSARRLASKAERTRGARSRMTLLFHQGVAGASATEVVTRVPPSFGARSVV